MAGASIEATLELWASSLRKVKSLLRPLFAQERAAVNAGLFLDGLLGDERRKTGWMRAEAAGDPGPWRQQALLGRDRWDADALRESNRAQSYLFRIAFPPFGYKRIDGMFEIFRMIVSLTAWVVLALVLGVAIGGLLAVLTG